MKSVLITGASTGIGKSCAKILSSNQGIDTESLTLNFYGTVGQSQSTYTNVLIFFILCILLIDLFQMYSLKKNMKENLDLISSQIGDLDEDIHLLEDLIEKNKD